MLLRSIVLFLFLSDGLVLLFGQEPFNFPAEKELQKTCETFLYERDIFLIYPDSSTENLVPVATDTLVLSYQLLKEYYALNNYVTRTDAIASTHIVFTESGPICRFNYTALDTIFFNLTFHYEHGYWKISGSEHRRADTQHLAQLQELRDSLVLLNAEKTAIKNCIGHFLAGLDDLGQLQDTNKLYLSCTPEAYTYFKIENELHFLHGYVYKKRKYDSFEIDYVELLSDSVAGAHVDIKHHGSTTVLLFKKNGEWRVAGENERTLDQETLQNKQLALHAYRVKSEIKQALFSFGLALNDVFIKNDYTALEQVATPEIAALARRMQHKAGNYVPAFLHAKKYTTFQPVSLLEEDFYRIHGDTVNFGSKVDKIQFHRMNDRWVVTGFYQYTHGKISEILIEDHFYDFISLAHFYYNSDTVDYAASLNVSETSSETTDAHQAYEDRYIREPFELSQPAHFVGGATALYAYISSNLNYPAEAKKNKLEGLVYVECIVEKDGSLTDLHVVSSPHELLSIEAIRLVSNMPKWVPAAEFKDIVRSRHTVVIPFTLEP